MLELLIYLVALYVVLHRKNIYKTTKKKGSTIKYYPIFLCIYSNSTSKAFVDMIDFLLK